MLMLAKVYFLPAFKPNCFIAGQIPNLQYKVI